MAVKKYYYQQGFRDYTKQFLRLFSGFQVQSRRDKDLDGVNDLSRVPVHYGDMDRVVANVLHSDGAFVSNSLPLIYGVETGIELGSENRRALYHNENVGRIDPTDGSYIIDQKTMGVPYVMSFDLGIVASNKTQLYQILEQILLMFNPKIAIQKSDNIIDWSYITEVELVGISPQSNTPAGENERFISYSLQFLVEVWLDYPSKKGKTIQEIITTIKDDTNDPLGFDIDTFTTP